MKTLKITTKKGYTAVILDDQITVTLKGEEGYLIYDNVANGTPCADQSDTEPFVAAYLSSIEKKKIAAAEKIEAERIAEQNRIAGIRANIEKCETPNELADMFGFSMVERASHWSDLYEGRSHYACHISNRSDYEIMQMAIDMLGIEGEWVELRHRAGEHHSTGSSVCSLDDYQKNLRNYFNGDKFFYRSQDSELEFICEKIIEEAENKDIESVRKLLASYDEVRNGAGYYDCNGNLEMLESDLESDEITGYRYDVYSFSFGFEFDHKYSFKAELEAEEE